MKRCLDTSKEIFCSNLIAESLKPGQHFQKSLTFTHDIIHYISLAILPSITCELPSLFKYETCAF